MNPAPAHLESKLRPILDFTVGQLAAVFCGLLLGVVWATWLCPVGGLWAATSGVYVAALPSLPVFLASQTDLDLWLMVRGAAGWRRAEGRFAPGPGQAGTGYALEDPEDAVEDERDLDLNLQALWEET